MMDPLGAIVDEDTEEENTEETPPYNLQLLPEGSPVPDEMPDETPICPRVGDEYQVEVPDSPLLSETVPADNQFLIGLPVPLTWADIQENDGPVPVPGTGTSHWNETEATSLVLGLYIFGKNLRLIQKFIESKSMGDVLAYYYGVFYKSDAYKKWFDCRKARTRRCIVGTRIFTSWRQQELVSRLLSAAPQEKHERVLEAIKSFNENTVSFEDFIFTLRSTIGLQTFIDAVAIGKGREDLTGPGPDSGRTAHSVPARPEIPSGKACSSLSPSEIIRFLTGDFRLSKARANDLFWEAVWPRLLARGWHSEQPRDLIGSKNSLVFLLPGIKKFSRKRLMKGEHYYDCVSDVLKKVEAEPGLLDIDSVVAGNEDGEWGSGTMSMSPKEYLRPKVRPRDGSELMQFMVVDTSMLYDGNRIKVRELKSLPAGVASGMEPGLVAGPSRVAISSDTSDSEDDNRSGVKRRDLASGEASEVNPVQTRQLVEGIDLGKGPIIDAVGNGHVAITSAVNDQEGHFGKVSHTSKLRVHKYLSPVPKRRRLSGCKQQGAGQKSLSFSEGNGDGAGHNGPALPAEADKGREGTHPQRKRKVKFLVKDVMKEETEPNLGSSGMVGTVVQSLEGETRVEPGPFDKPKEVGTGTSPRKRKVKELKVTETECKPGLEAVVDQTKLDSNSSAQATQSVKEAAPTKRQRKVTFLFRESLERESNVMPHLIDGSEMGANLIQHDSGLSKKPKKVIRRKPKSSGKEVKKEIETLVKEVKNEIEVPSASVVGCEVRKCQIKEIEIPETPAVKEEHHDFNLNKPETAPMDVGTSDKSSAPVPSESKAMMSGRRVSTRNRPPTVRALEAVANGFLGGPKQRNVSAPSRKARRSGGASRRSKVEETVGPISSEDANAVELSAVAKDESCNGNYDRPVVDLTGDVQPDEKACDNVIQVDLST
ncbi:arginine-glutamic acid dipeptide repeat protein [Rhynchospora pubera]|uniref:Arginine-glutamic acid dipeptide repeat protein n=1 Tax=Rhynchospora pubera TaxID=906938 RepID=A0AAV8CFE4_9POAL|nr:arginine-glutamic acid dipeptide repeat protein [Rhynchospora pubera]